MTPTKQPLACIAFMLMQHDAVLLERRSLTKRLLPGALAIPGGHIELGESPEDALFRELAEELGITPRTVRYVCTLLHRAQEFRKLHYFAIESWDGTIVPREADALQWVRLDDLAAFDLDVDRVAVREYLRVYRPETQA
jgi:8-oxo-dGTP diphosphatase